ncbi:MAG TPA: hypothetical protein VEB69_06190 [Acidimicrobiia bacterium]|nr:hypothetical protein [Acidimicrobiia bacterium]
MSRFSPFRVAAIAVWTGAAVTWGTTVIAPPQQVADPGEPDPQQRAVVDSINEVSIPEMPSNGLVIIRPPREERNQPVTVVVEPVANPPGVSPPQPRSAGS